MKAYYTCILSLFVFSLVNAQSYYTDFEDETLQEWTNIDASTTAMSVQGETGNKYLQKICDGTSTAVGSMAIINAFEFNGDYTCDNPSGINCFGEYRIMTRNVNAFDLHLRLGAVGGNGTLVASQDAVVVPANSDWIEIQFEPYATQLAVVSGSGTVEETMADVQQIRIFHNESFTFDGAFVTGNLEIDFIWLLQLLETDEFSLEKTTLFPNPARDVLTVSLSQAMPAELTVYNLLGDEVYTTTGSTKNIALPVARLNTGVYLLRITAEGQVITRKFVKR